MAEEIKEKEKQRKPVVKALINIGIVLVAMLGIWVGLTIVFGTTTPFFVVSSGSMEPVLLVGDIIVVNGNAHFQELHTGDIIVFNEPGIGRVIVHRVLAIMDDPYRRIETKGDNNYAPDDWRVTSKDYIGRVLFIIPKVGLLTTILTPPTNYILIVVIIAAVFILELRSQKSEEEQQQQQPQPEQSGSGPTNPGEPPV